MNEIHLFNAMIGFVWSTFMTLFSIPTITRVAYLCNIFDKPDERKRHKVPIPRIGGVIVFVSFLIAILSFIPIDTESQRFLGAATLLFILGFKDDMTGANSKKKLLIQGMGAIILLSSTDIRIESLGGLFGVYELPIVLSYLLSFFFILTVTNSFNLIDGVNGLMGSLSFFVSIALFGMLYAESHSVAAVMLVSSGGFLGFLRYNMGRSEIFMGDAGSLAFGILLSASSLHYLKIEDSSTGLSVMISLLFVPIFDTIRVFLIRIARGNSPFTPGRDHIHHALLSMRFSHFQTTCILVSLNIFVYLFCISFSFLGNYILSLFLLALGIWLHIFVWMSKLRRKSCKETTVYTCLLKKIKNSRFFLK